MKFMTFIRSGELVTILSNIFVLELITPAAIPLFTTSKTLMNKTKKLSSSQTFSSFGTECLKITSKTPVNIFSSFYTDGTMVMGTLVTTIFSSIRKSSTIISETSSSTQSTDKTITSSSLITPISFPSST